MAGTTLHVVRFGAAETLTVEDGQDISFAHGLVGMPHLRRFALLEDERIVPCRWLQSLDDPSVAFLVVDPLVLDASYRLELGEDDLTSLSLAAGEEADAWALITVRPEPEQTTANLLAPVVVNPRARLGAQLVMHESGYSLRHALRTPTSQVSQSPARQPEARSPGVTGERETGSSGSTASSDTGSGRGSA